MKRRTVLAPALAGAVLPTSALAGCGPSSGSAGGKEVTELRYQGSVGAVTLPELAEDLGYLGRIRQVVGVPLTARSVTEDLRSDPEFAHYRHEIWSLLRDEVDKARTAELKGVTRV